MEISIEPTQAKLATRELLISAGCNKSVAERTSTGLWSTSMKGIDSHGLRHLPHYIKVLETKRINGNPKFNFIETGVSTGKLDADHSFGHAAGVEAMKESIRLAHNSGIGAVSVGNSSHCGALSYFAELACNQDMIGLAFTHATPKVQTFNSKKVFFGTNPICFAAPMLSEGPFCFDSAPTLFTFNKIRLYKDLGIHLPEGVAADGDGNETHDPQKAMQLLPIGQHKGFGLSMIVDILCALLSSMPSGNNVSEMFGKDLSTKRFLGQFFIALKIEHFTDPKEFKERLQESAESIRNLEPASTDKKVMLPGDPEKDSWQKRTIEGIPLPETIIKEIQSYQKKYRTQEYRFIQ
jgi:ureidoglycolate dehydrogenase (NAD+)